MAFYEWNDKLAVNNMTIDNQHKKLIALINDLYDAMGKGTAKEIMGKILDELIKYTKTHFGDEENLMVKYSYPDSASHLAEHKAFVEKVDSVYNDFQNGNNYLSISVMNFLKDWLNKHIMEVDQKFGAFLATQK